jgi:acetoin utilization deacetylase AcuC-like enzyme
MPLPVFAADTSESRRTGLVYDERYLEHLIYRQHPESPDRLRAIMRKVEESGLAGQLEPLVPSTDIDTALHAHHTARHIESIADLPVTGEVARLAVAGAVGAVDAVCTGKVRNAFCALRPPGHHARNTGQEEGFCFYNNIGVAVEHARKTYGLRRILVIDWDYHHGNATEQAFYEDPEVLFFSTHDRGAYPGTGDPKRTGAGRGKGYTINVHCGCGTDDDRMLRIWERSLLPAAEKFKPEIVFISAGFDSRKDDPLGCFSVTDLGFARLTRHAMSLAETWGEGRLVSLLEGGYNPHGLAEAVYAHIKSLLG